MAFLITSDSIFIINQAQKVIEDLHAGLLLRELQDWLAFVIKKVVFIIFLIKAMDDLESMKFHYNLIFS